MVSGRGGEGGRSNLGNPKKFACLLCSHTILVVDFGIFMQLLPILPRMSAYTCRSQMENPEKGESEKKECLGSGGRGGGGGGENLKSS